MPVLINAEPFSVTLPPREEMFRRLRRVEVGPEYKKWWLRCFAPALVNGLERTSRTVGVALAVFTLEAQAELPSSPCLDVAIRVLIDDRAARKQALDDLRFIRRLARCRHSRRCGHWGDTATPPRRVHYTLQFSGRRRQ
jgi:hypothetical protein